MPECRPPLCLCSCVPACCLLACFVAFPLVCYKPSMPCHAMRCRRPHALMALTLCCALASSGDWRVASPLPSPQSPRSSILETACATLSLVVLTGLASSAQNCERSWRAGDKIRPHERTNQSEQVVLGLSVASPYRI
jgi:hypothetical protein